MLSGIPSVEKSYFAEWAHRREAWWASHLPISRRSTRPAAREVGRNSRCRCGSGEKFKRCYGGDTSRYPTLRGSARRCRVRRPSPRGVVPRHRSRSAGASLSRQRMSRWSASFT